ncbi:MAG: hypothetical protein JXA73_10340 [Acidobacteria bacterium]|nr:hypothetical protein [Acidobacteriota bacterium]
MAAGFGAATLLIILLTGIPAVTALPAGQAGANASLEKIKSMAEAQHEIVVILVKKKDYEKAAAEANKIFEMNWPENQESLLVKELRTLSDLFLNAGQAPLSLKLIERNYSRFKNRTSQAALLKEMGYIHKSLGQDDKAIEYFRKARDLEGGK